MTQKIKSLLLVAFLAVLSLPMIQQALSFYASDPLSGNFDVVSDTAFSWEGWLAGTYQQRENAFYNDHMGFRPDLIRIKDQADLWLFHKLNYGGCVLGKNNCLFWDNYIDAYTGRDFAGDSFIRRQLFMLKALQDTFARTGKTLLVIHCPNKAFYYHELIPEDIGKVVGKNNYSVYKTIGDSLGIHQIDINGWFMAMKDTCKELLMTRQGTHWSVYGSVIAGDSIVRYIERKRNLRLPHAEWIRIEHVHGARYTDKDIVDNANLLFPNDNETFSYPVIQYGRDTTARKLKTIFIGDSFVMNFITNKLPQGTFPDWQYWFYFKYLSDATNSDISHDRPVPGGSYWIDEIKKADCILLAYTSMNLRSSGENQLGSGFIEKAYEYYYPQKK